MSRSTFKVNSHHFVISELSIQQPRHDRFPFQFVQSGEDHGYFLADTTIGMMRALLLPYLVMFGHPATVSIIRPDHSESEEIIWPDLAVRKEVTRTISGVTISAAAMAELRYYAREHRVWRLRRMPLSASVNKAATDLQINSLIALSSNSVHITPLGWMMLDNPNYKGE